MNEYKVIIFKYCDEKEHPGGIGVITNKSLDEFLLDYKMTSLSLGEMSPESFTCFLDMLEHDESIITIHEFNSFAVGAVRKSYFYKQELLGQI